MHQQTTISMPEQPEKDWGTCAWCGEQAFHELELEPPQYTHRRTPGKKTIKLLKRAALTAPVCKDHYYSLERNPDRESSDKTGDF